MLALFPSQAARPPRLLQGTVAQPDACGARHGPHVPSLRENLPFPPPVEIRQLNLRGPARRPQGPTRRPAGPAGQPPGPHTGPSQVGRVGAKLTLCKKRLPKFRVMCRGEWWRGVRGVF